MMGGQCRGRVSRESFPTPLKSLNSFRAYLCRSSSSDEHRPGNYADEYTRARKAVGARDQAYVDVSGLGCLLEEMRGCSSVPLRCVAEHGDDKGDGARAHGDPVGAPPLQAGDGPRRRGVRPEEEQVGGDLGRRAEQAGDVPR